MEGRLGLLSQLVREAMGDRLVDIGSDHATVPIELLKSGALASVLVTDVREAPLFVAKKRAHDAQITEGFSSELSDGLSEIQLKERDVLLISGMGGETIEKILRHAPSKLHLPKRIILQPQTKEENVRRAMTDLRLPITEEYCLFDQGQVYLVIVSDKNDETVRPLSDLDYYFGPHILERLRRWQENQHVIDGAYLDYTTKRLRRLMKQAPYEVESMERLEQFKKQFEVDKILSYNDGGQMLSQSDGRGAISKERR